MASPRTLRTRGMRLRMPVSGGRSEEHTSELQSQSNLVCRLLLEKKKKKKQKISAAHNKNNNRKENHRSNIQIAQTRKITELVSSQCNSSTESCNSVEHRLAQ